ncbi:hypothetical protein ACFLXA_03965 [Chloroflexota bacterium]
MSLRTKRGNPGGEGIRGNNSGASSPYPASEIATFPDKSGSSQ